MLVRLGVLGVLLLSLLSPSSLVSNSADLDVSARCEASQDASVPLALAPGTSTGDVADAAARGQVSWRVARPEVHPWVVEARVRARGPPPAALVALVSSC